MNVERVSRLEIDPTGTPRERAGAKGSGFSDLMDSVLDPVVEKQAAERESAETQQEKAPRGRVLRADVSGARKPVRDGNALAEEALVEEAVVASEPVREELASRETEPTKAREDEAELGAAILAVSDAAVVASVVAPLAAPVLEALANGAGSQEAESGEIVVEESGAAAEGATDDPVLDGLMRGLPEDGAAEIAEATTGRSVIADASARDGLLAALEGARAGKDSAEVVVNAEAPPTPEGEPSIEAAPALERSLPVATRPVQGVEDAKRVELETAVLRASGTPKPETGSPTDLGSEDASRDRRGATPQPVLVPVERSSGEPAAAPTSAATDVTSAIQNEAAPVRREETSAPTHVDGLMPTSTTRAPEAPPTLQTGRALPTAAPEAIAVQADWLATRGGGTARLVLNPPELGEIAIRVTVRQQSVEIVMVAQTALAHSMAEDQGDRLSQAFAHRDLRLDQFEVRRGDPSDSSGSGQFGSSDAGNRERERATEERPGLADAGGRGGRRPTAAAGGAMAAPARFVPSGRDARVDLRI